MKKNIVVSQNLVSVLVLVLLSISCSNKYPWFEEKGYCFQSEYLNFYEEIEINKKAFYDGGKLDYKVPFLLKADSIYYEGDTTIELYGEQVQFDKLLIKTRFKYREKRGVAGAPIGKSKNSFEFVMYSTNDLTTSIQENIISDMLEKLGEDQYKVASKGQAKIIISDDEQQKLYMYENYSLIIPRPLPIGQYDNISCGITGDGETFVYEGLAFCCEYTYFLPDDLLFLTLSMEEIRRLYED